MTQLVILRLVTVKLHNCIMHHQINKLAHNFYMQVGKQFDALLVDTQAPDTSNPVFYTFPQDSMAVSLLADKQLQWNHHCSMNIVKDLFTSVPCVNTKNWDI